MASNPVDSLSFSGNALCGLSFGVFRFRSIDAMCLFVGAVGGWAVFTRLPVGVSALPGVGVITCVALGLCLGAIVVTVERKLVILHLTPAQLAKVARVEGVRKVDFLPKALK